MGMLLILLFVGSAFYFTIKYVIKSESNAKTLLFGNAWSESSNYVICEKFQKRKRTSSKNLQCPNCGSVI